MFEKSDEYDWEKDAIGSFYEAIKDAKRRHQAGEDLAANCRYFRPITPSQHNAAERSEAVQFGDRTQPTPVSIKDGKVNGKL